MGILSIRFSKFQKMLKSLSNLKKALLKLTKNPNVIVSPVVPANGVVILSGLTPHLLASRVIATIKVDNMKEVAEPVTTEAK